MSSMFHRLLSYSPRPGRTPTEDFFTEVFAEVAREVACLLPAIFDHGNRIGRLSQGWPLEAGASWKITTQYRLPSGRRPDMVLLVGQSPRLIIENKIGAPFTLALVSDEQDSGSAEAISQVPAYASEVSREKLDARVALVSLRPRDVGLALDPCYIGNLLWSDVYDALQSLNSPATERGRVLVAELIPFMESLGMKPLDTVKRGASLSYWQWNDTREAMDGLLCEAIAKVAPKYNISQGTRSKGTMYVYQTIDVGGPPIGLVFIVANRDVENQPVYLVLHVGEGADSGRFIAEFNSEPVGIPKWKGWFCYPSDVLLDAMLDAPDWNTQVEATANIIFEFFDRLVTSGLITMR